MISGNSVSRALAIRSWSCCRELRSSVPYAASCTRACLKRYVACGGTPCRNNRPAAIRRSSPLSSARCDFRATAASRACENSRPITAPICAISLADPSRSSRAISEACRLAGTATAGDGMAPTAPSVAPSPNASNTALVISSTNSGMPSVRSIMSCLILPSSGLSPLTRSIKSAISRSPRRLRLSAVT